MRDYFSNKTSLCGVVLMAFMLNACVSDGDFNFMPSATKTSTDARPLIYASINPDKITTDPRRLAAQGLKSLDEGKLDDALKSFNQALKLKMTDSTLNFLAGLTYHLMAVKGDDSKFFLAEEGYKLAIKFDNSNWYARFQSGLLALDQRKFVQAQSHFSKALIYNTSDPDLLYSMLVASYYAGDITTSAVMRDRLKELEPDSSRLLKASVMASSALNNTDKATASLVQLAAISGQGNQVAALKRRMADWRAFHKNNIQLAQSWQETIGSSAAPAPDPSSPSAAPVTPVTKVDPDDQSNSDTDVDSDNSEPSSDVGSDTSNASTDSAEPLVIDPNGMVIVDVTIIRTQDNRTTAKGVNLLNGLSLQFGDESGTGTAGFSAIDTISKTIGSNTRTITRAINIPAITYSLNIANVNDTRNEILARPTLTATNGSESKFFSGVHIQAAVLPSGGSGTGDSVTFDDEVGVKLSVTPTLLDDGRVKLDVTAERKFLNTPDSSYTGFTSKLESTRTTVSATVAMHFGETLILSGLSEKETENIKDGVPILQDIPLIQYFFSRETTKDFTKSVMILLTPRQPQYTFKEGKTTGPRVGQNPALSELRDRYMDWFNPYSTAEAIFYHMQDNRLYRELRTGDVSLERWENYSGFRDRLKDALDFLYY